MSDKLKHARTNKNHRPLHLARGIELVAALTFSLSTPAFATDGVKINDLVVATSISDAQREATIKAVRAFYGFWNTGDEALLKHAIAPHFNDNTPPPIRPQAPKAPPFPSRRC